jgi:hypothetical protein
MIAHSFPTTESLASSLALPIGPQVVEVIKRGYASGTPVLLEGSHGVGKSELVAQAARELGIHVICRDLTCLETVDLAGYPYRDEAEGVMKFAPPAFLPKPTTQPRGLLLLEELNRCSLSTQHAAMQILTTRRIHDYELPTPGWLPISTCNPREPGRYQTSVMDAALLSRFIRVKVTADAASWQDWAEANSVHPAVRRYVSLLSDPFNDPDGLSNPRSWTYVSNLLNASTDLDSLGDLEAGALGAAIAGLVGSQHATSLLTTLRGTEELLDPQAILGGAAGWMATVRRWLAEGRLDLLAKSLQKLLRFIRPEARARKVFDNAERLASLQSFLGELPGDLREVVAKFARKTGYTQLTDEPNAEPSTTSTAARSRTARPRSLMHARAARAIAARHRSGGRA